MVLIKGIAVPLGVRNKNGQGVPLSEAENVINSLKSAVVRISSPNSEHLDDLLNNNAANIGKTKNIWREGNNIWASAQIDDHVANREFQRGAWNGIGWSPFSRTAQWNDGWASNLDINSLTLVTKPAYDQNVVALAASTDPQLHFFNTVFLASEGINMTEQEQPADAVEKTAAEEQKTEPVKTEQVAETVTQEPTTLEPLKTKYEALLEEKDKAIEGFKNTIESLNTKMAGMFDKKDLESFKAAFKQELADDKSREAFLASLQKSHETLNSPFAAAEFEGYSLPQLEAQAGKFETLANNASVNQAGRIAYGTSANNDGKSTGPVFEAGKGWL